MAPKRKRIYIGLSLAGVGAVIVDRAVLPANVVGPSQAAAALVDRPIAGDAQHDDADWLDRSIPALPFPPNVESFDPNRGLRDLFLPPAMTHEKGAARVSDNDASRTASMRAAGFFGFREFQQAHTLKAVFVDRDIRIAIVDEAWLKVGSTLSGCKLVDITGLTAKFECDDGMALLNMAGR